MGLIGNPPQDSCLENPMDGQRSLVGYSPWGNKELDTTERLHDSQNTKTNRYGLDHLEKEYVPWNVIAKSKY